MDDVLGLWLSVAVKKSDKRVAGGSSFQVDGALVARYRNHSGGRLIGSPSETKAQGTIDAMNNMLTCTSCGLDKTESVVHFGSYILRCAACGETIVTTSFMAMLNSDYECSAFVDPGPGQFPPPETIVARGPLRLIATAISAAASDGTLIRLISEPLN